ncbi:MAG: PQQ-binding-like beta-propeller repeat protein [Planctomycetota bacterium]
MPVRRRFVAGLLTAMLLFVAGPQTGSAQDWTSVRGPNYDGSATGASPLLDAGPLSLTRVWKHKIGSGYSGIVNSGDVLVTAAADANAGQEFVIALDAATGKPVWSINLKERFGSQPNFYGFGASPIVHKGKVILPVGAGDPQQGGAIMAFDAATGDVLWQAGQDTAGFQTSVLIGDGESRSSGVDLSSGQPQTSWNVREIRNTYCVLVEVKGVLCTYSSRFLIGLHPATGERLFRQRQPGNGFVGKLGNRLVIVTLEGSLHIGDVHSDGFEEVVSIEVMDQGGSNGNGDGRVWTLPTLAGGSIYVRSVGAIARVGVASADTSLQIQNDRSQVGTNFASKAPTGLPLGSSNPKSIVCRMCSLPTTPRCRTPGTASALSAE